MVAENFPFKPHKHLRQDWGFDDKIFEINKKQFDCMSVLWNNVPHVIYGKISTILFVRRVGRSEDIIIGHKESLLNEGNKHWKIFRK